MFIKYPGNIMVKNESKLLADELYEDFRRHQVDLSFELYDGHVFVRQFKEGPIIIEKSDIPEIIKYLVEIQKGVE